MNKRQRKDFERKGYGKTYLRFRKICADVIKLEISIFSDKFIAKNIEIDYSKNYKNIINIRSNSDIILNFNEWVKDYFSLINKVYHEEIKKNRVSSDLSYKLFEAKLDFLYHLNSLNRKGE